MENVLTVGEVAERLGIKIHRAEYLLRSRNVQPAGMAGRYRLFDESAIQRLQKELKKAEK